VHACGASRPDLREGSPPGQGTGASQVCKGAAGLGSGDGVTATLGKGRLRSVPISLGLLVPAMGPSIGSPHRAPHAGGRDVPSIIAATQRRILRAVPSFRASLLKQIRGAYSRQDLCRTFSQATVSRFFRDHRRGTGGGAAQGPSF
jgi:hypothetical protein